MSILSLSHIDTIIRNPFSFCLDTECITSYRQIIFISLDIADDLNVEVCVPFFCFGRAYSTVGTSS